MIGVLLGWGVAMAVIGTVGLLFYGFGDTETPSLFYGTAALIVTIAVLLWATGLGRSDPYSARALPAISPPVPLLAVGAIFAALGAELGWWLTLIGAGLAALAVGGLAREWLFERRMVRSAADERTGGREA